MIQFAIEMIWIVAVIAALIAFPWSIIYVIERVAERLAHARTLRRYHDFSNCYYDYRHQIWVAKTPEPAQVSACEC